MFDVVGLPPVVQGAVVVLIITVLAVGLSVGYAVIERILGSRLLDALDTT